MLDACSSGTEKVVRRQFTQTLVILATLGACWSGVAFAQQWDTLGNVRLKPGGWENTVEVLHSDVVAEIRIDVEGANVDMSDIRLQFDNGTVWVSGLKLYFRDGSRSQIVKLPDAAHRIRRVGFTYKAIGGGPLVSVYGRTTPPTTEASWVHLGAQTVDFARDRDSMDVVADDSVRELRFWVDINDVDLSKVRITYSSGQVISLPAPVPLALHRGRVVELPGGGGVVRRIEFSYQSPFKRENQGQGKSLIHVFGRP